MAGATRSEQSGAGVFDVAVLIANIALVGPLTRLVRSGEDISPLFGGLLLAGCLAYAAGAGLKRRPLQHRMSRQPSWSGWALLFFLVLGTMHLGVFGLAAILGVEGLRLSGPLAGVVGVTAGLAPTCLAVYALLPMRHTPADGDALSRWREPAADVGLWFGTVILFALWEGAIVPAVAGKAGGHLLLSILLVALMTVPFAIFYLAPRMLFLAEDFRKGSTWLRIGLVALPLAWRIAMGT